MINKINSLLLLLILTVIFSCGKKLDPKPKDSIIIPAPQNIVLENRNDGIYIKNNEEYTLFVEKSSIDDKRCASDFRFLTKLKNGEEFIDRNVEESLSYVYRFTSIDEAIGVESIFRTKSILYSKPISITNLIITPKPTGEAQISLEFDHKPRGFTIKINNKDLGRFQGDNITLLLEDREQNEIIITPYDQYNNIGIPKKVIYQNPRVYFITPPSNIKHIFDEKVVLLNWDDVPYATGYKIYDTNNNLMIDTKVNYTKIEINRCIEFYISSYNDYVESEKRYTKICE